MRFDRILFLSFRLLVLTSILSRGSSAKKKRQLYREHLLPDKGGKIPESAFQADRLALNRLNKEGIAIPDGVLLDQRRRESHYRTHREDPDITRNIIRLVQTPDGRFTPAEGRYPTFDKEIESTYIIRSPINEPYSILPPYRPLYGSEIRIPTRMLYTKLYPKYPSLQHHNAITTNQLYSGSQFLQQNSIYPPVQDWKIWETALTTPGFDAVKNFHLGGILNKIGYIPDYPSYTEIPLTNFACDKSGRMYPDPEAKCQVFHLCHYDGHKETFLCPPGSRFEPITHECAPWHKTQCVSGPSKF